MRLAPVFAASVLVAGVFTAVGLSTTSGASLPVPVTVKMTPPTWGLPLPCPPHCTTTPTFADH